MPEQERFDRTRRLGEDGETRHLDDGGATRRLDDEADRDDDGYRFDAEGDTVYDAPAEDEEWADDEPPSDERDGAAADQRPSGPPVRQRRGSRLRTFMWFLFGLGLGFLAALVIVAVYGNTSFGAGDDDAALRQELADTEQQLEDLRGTIEQRDQQVSDLQERLEDAVGEAERADALERLRETLDARQQDLDRLDDELEQRQQQIEERLDEADPDGLPTPDVDLPNIDGEEAQAWIDRAIESLRDLFR